MRVLSLGWGVQSWTLAAMSALGELEPLDVAIHADTGYERQSTYEFAEKWTPWLQEHGVPVETVRCVGRKSGVSYPNEKPSGRGIHSHLSVNIPAFTTGRGLLSRQCTMDWKLRPFRARLRELLAGQCRCAQCAEKRSPTAEVWLGISADEFQRARDADVKYLRNRYPLLERNIDRAGCIAWLNRGGLEAPTKSACVFCPYQNRASFARLKRNGGSDWQVALAADAEIRDARPPFQLFVHPDRVPLAEAVDIPEDHGYIQTGFDPEGKCDEGVCWV